MCLCANSGAAEHTIKIVSLANTNDEDYAGARAFEDFVESHSKGEIEVRIFTGGQLCGSPMECLLALDGGVMEVFMSTLGGLGNLFPEIQVLDLPYLFDDDEIAEKVLSGPFLLELREALLERTGLRLMTIGNTGGWRNVANTRRPIHTPADMVGLKIRTINSPIQIELTKELGAGPTPIPWPELYTALATGVVDGSKNGLVDIVSMRFQEHIKFITMDQHGYMSALWLMNDAAWNRLSVQQKQIVEEGFEILRQATLALPKERRAQAIESFEAAGGSVHWPTREEKAAFVEAAKPVQQWYTRRYGNVWLDRVRQAIAEAALESAE